MIGKPNSGKSNFMEALSLFNPSNFRNPFSLLGFYKDAIRFKKLSELFYFKNYNEKILIETDKAILVMLYDVSYNKIVGIVVPREVKDKMVELLEKYTSVGEFIQGVGENIKPYGRFIIEKNFDYPQHSSNEYIVSDIDIPHELSYVKSIKRFLYLDLDKMNKTITFSELQPPFGSNIFTVLRKNKKIYDRLLNKSVLKFMRMRRKENTIWLRKRKGN